MRGCSRGNGHALSNLPAPSNVLRRPIATVLHAGSLCGKFLELPAVRFIGRISYSLYLWQQFFSYAFAPPSPGSFRSHQLLCFAATSACAVASYYLIETPLIRVGHRLRGTLTGFAGSGSTRFHRWRKVAEYTVQAARKPNFVLDDHSSRPCLTAWLKQPTRRFRLFSSCEENRSSSPGRDGPSRAGRLKRDG
jgi:hypothetical protein